MPKTRALVPLADGVEEMEAVIIVDVLRRADWLVTTASISGKVVTASRGIRLMPDVDWNEIAVEDFDAFVLPGGARAATAFCEDHRILAAARAYARPPRLLAAICSAPLVLHAAGVLVDRCVTCHPSVAQQLTGVRLRQEPVVVDWNIVTARGAGAAFEFALTLIRLNDGAKNADDIAEAIML